MNLIIAEKAIAGQRIASLLAGKPIFLQREDAAQIGEFQKEGKKFVVIPLRGHISNVDFPQRYSYWLGTDLKQLTMAPIEYKESEKAIINLLRKKAKDAKAVIIATDADREGESIGVEALDYLKQGNPKLEVKRAYFSALTPKDIQTAFSKLAKVDFPMADSANARREVDLIWGAVLTRFVSLMSGRMGKAFLSVGRVQTPVLALIVAREKERRAFKSQKYWVLSALFEKDKVKFEAEHKKGKLWDKSEAEKILGKKDAYGVVSDVQTKKRILEKPLPFNTTSFLRASTALGLTAGEAMNIAETLYQMGFTSYPRTDNAAYHPTLDLKQILLELQKVPSLDPLVKKILALPKLVPSKGKETKDHPPIHPVSAANPAVLTEKQWKVYELICRRFLATLAEEAITFNTRVELLVKDEPFIATGQTILKKGWKEFYPYSTLKEVFLPKLEKGDKAALLDLKMEGKETQPPARYSQSALIKLMDELGLGTKCFSGNTALKVFNSPTPKIFSMQEVFEKSQFTGLMDDSAEIRENKKLECIGAAVNGSIKRSRFPIVSKRPTDSKKDKMKRLIFPDGSIVEATGKHPFLCFNGNTLFKPLSKIAPGDKIVSLHDNACSTVQGSIEWQSFIKKCDKNTYLFAHGLSAKLKRTRLNFNKSQRAFAHWLGCSQGNYSSYESDKRPIPLCLLKKINLVPKKISSQNEKALVSNPFPLKITAPLARILAKLIGDGSLDREKVKRENCFDFRYTNTNPDLIEEFVQDVEKVFKTRSRIYYRPENEKVSVKVPVVMGRMPAVVGRIVSILFPDVLNKLPWKKLPNALFPDFVGAFFDDEGHVTKKESKLFLSNTNHQTLRVLQKMLKTLNIESSLDTKQHKLHVRRRQSLFNFLEKIPVTSVKKKQRLMDIISTHYKYGAKNRPLFVFEKQLLAVLKEPKTTAELAGIFGVSKSSIVSRIRKLRKERKVKKLVDGNNKDVPRTIQYGSLVDLSNSGYSILEEQAIKPKLVTKTVKRIENIPLPPAVYDITNSLEHPAFVLANNVIAHNSTRHEIIQKLYYRQYISGLKSIEPNEIAFAVISSLEKHCKTVTEPKMTAELEAEMDEIAVGKKPKDSVVLESRNVLLKVLEQLLKDKNEIATELRQGLRQDSIVGKCTDASCEGELIIRHGKTGKRFLGCTKYPKCTVTYPLPQKGKLIVLNKECETCQAPMIRLINQRSAFAMCINHNCATKEEWKKRAAEKKAKALQKPATKKAPKKTATTKAKTTRKKKKN